ncbi:hypothetical protein CRENBAI_007446 [Crenichthys baileyi]|uniref:Uncharacterized protein n=1 Tax=Crenichthys baileyi TaxID=28760 RepID=A0AAV9SLF5_9TELE
MELRGGINFTLIRIALVDCAKFTLLAATQEQVSTSMCHDTRTDDRFYSHNPNLHEALRVRDQMTSTLQSLGEGTHITLKAPAKAPAKALAKALPKTPAKATPAKATAKAKARAKVMAEESSSSDSEEETPVPYQESGHSSSSQDSEEVAQRQLRPKLLPPTKRQPGSYLKSAKIRPFKRAHSEAHSFQAGL